MNPPDQPTIAPTPRTDAESIRFNHVDSFDDRFTVPADFARTLERELATAQAERDLAITRVACILWSGAIDKHTCGDVQKWADYYTAELTRLRAELASKTACYDIACVEVQRLRADLERFTGHGLLDCHAICDQRDAAVAERDQLRAEVERLNDIINRAGVQFFHDGTDGQTAEKMLTVLNETKLLKNKTTTP
jgi:hypothetical protein